MRVFLACALLLLAAAAARAETTKAECVALGWQTEHSSEVFVGTVQSETDRGASGFREVTIRVDEAIRGPLAVGANAVVVSPDYGHGKTWTIGGRCLAFLEDAPGAAARFRPVSGSFGVRPLPTSGPETRFPDIVRKINETLDLKGAVVDAPTLRASLVGWLEDADPGVAWSAATDLVRHAELVAALTVDERARILVAYDRQPIGKTTKEALAFAVAAAKPPGAAQSLVATLSLPTAKFVRSSIGEALRRLGDPTSETLLDRALTTADAPSRKSLLVAAGFVGTQAFVPAARRSLADDDAAVRAEAAHALGLIARNVRDVDAAARIEGREDLAHLVSSAKSDDERRAALWALAQLDTQEAWAELRRAAADESLPASARRDAAQFLATPRVSLLME